MFKKIDKVNQIYLEYISNTKHKIKYFQRLIKLDLI